MDEQPQTDLTKYGLMRKNYLKEYKKGIYSGMLLEGKLMEHLLEVQEAADQRMEMLTNQMAKTAGVDEELKSMDQMRWVQMMNNIRQSAEEIILEELIYN
ncbi:MULTISPECIES: TnpV protein [Clostridia]